MHIVTGAAGFIGSAYVWELNRHGIHDVVVADDWGTGEKWKNLAGLRVRDFVPKDDLLHYLDLHQHAVQHVIHMGACSSTTERDVDFLLENNYRYSQRLFQWCAKHKKPFLYASSCATYGAGERGYDDAFDSEQLRPLNPYGYSKVIFDRWAVRQNDAPPYWIGLRYSNVYGPNEFHKDDQSSVIMKAFDQIQTTGRLKLFKSYRPEYRDGEQMRDFVYIKDVTKWMFQFSAQSAQGIKGSGIYNCGFGKARSWNDLARAVFAAMEEPVNIEYIEMPASLRTHYQYFTEAKMDRVLARGLAQPEWDLQKGIRDYVVEYLSKQERHLSLPAE